MENVLPRALSIAILASLVASSASAETFYVATDGDDGSAGTSDAPFRTITRAVNAAGAGDEVVVRAGSYAGFQVTDGGSADAPLVFRGMGEVIIDEANPETPDGINLEGADYVVVEGFTVVDAPRVGIRTVLSRGVTIRNNVVRGSGLTGILSGFAYDLRIEGNVSSGALDEHGIYVSNSDEPNDNVVVVGNESFGNGTNGIQFNGDCDDSAGLLDHNVIENNFVHDNDQKGLSLISFASSIIRNNVIVDNGIEAGAGGIHLTDEIDCGMPSDDNLVVNNTIVESRITGIRINGGSAGNVIFNNIVVSSRGSSRILVDEDGGNTIDDATNLVLDDVGSLFVDAVARDFRPSSDSDARDVGASSFGGRDAPESDFYDNGRPVGDGWDIGAIEACEGAACEPPPERDGGTTPPDAGGGGADASTGDGGGGTDAGADGGSGGGGDPSGGCAAAGELPSAPTWLALLAVFGLLRVRGSRLRTLSFFVVLFLLGCGRMGFDSAAIVGGDGDAGPDPVRDAAPDDAFDWPDASGDAAYDRPHDDPPDPSLTRAWTELAMSPSPPALACPGLAHDPVTGESHVYGGFIDTDVASDAHWSLSSSGWAEACPGCPGPGPRAGHALVYDPIRGGLLLFGGVDETGATRNDTWLYRGGAWTELDELFLRPAPRRQFFHAYDPARGVLVVYGGLPDRYVQPYEDLWELHSDGWRGPFVAPAGTGPGPRYSCDGGTWADSLALHPEARGRFVIFGGSVRDIPDPSDVFDDAWAWGGSENGWRELCADCTGRARTSAGVEYDPCTGRIVIAGGYNSRIELDGTWEIGDGEVRQTSGAPLARDSMGFSYDPVRDSLVAFGGDGDSCEARGACDETLAMLLPASD